MSTPYQERALGSVIVDPNTEAFWQGTRCGQLRLRRCSSCHQVHWYPRPVCPFCQGNTEWVDAQGTGEIYSVSVTRKAGPVPYALAYVRLDEGVSLLTNIVDCDLDTVHIGQRVRVCFKPSDDAQQVAMFTPL